MEDSLNSKFEDLHQDLYLDALIQAFINLSHNLSKCFGNAARDYNAKSWF